MTSEVARYFNSRPTPPTMRRIELHFRQQGKEVLVAPVSQEEVEMLNQVGIAYFEEDGANYVIATIPQPEK